jgi:hypothetical protein
MVVTVENDKVYYFYTQVQALLSRLPVVRSNPLSFLSCYAGQTPGYPRNTLGQALLFTQVDRHNNKRPLFLSYPDASRPLGSNQKKPVSDCAHDREQ